MSVLPRIVIGTNNWHDKTDREDILGFCQCNGMDTIEILPNSNYLKQVNSYFNVIAEIEDDELDESRTYYAILCGAKSLGDAMIDKLTMYKRRGICEKTGLSLYLTQDVEKSYNFDIVQIPYSVFDRRFEKYFPIWKEKGIEIHTRSVFLQGVAFEPEKLFAVMSDKLIPKINTIKNLGNLPFLLLTYALLNTNIDKVVMGIDSLDMLKKNLSIFQTLDSLEIKDEHILLPYNWS